MEQPTIISSLLQPSLMGRSSLGEIHHYSHLIDHANLDIQFYSKIDSDHTTGRIFALGGDQIAVRIGW